MRRLQRLPRRRHVALFRQRRGHFAPDFAEADAGAGIGVVNPQPTPIRASFAGVRPEPGQGAKSGKGTVTAGALVLDSRTNLSIRATIVSFAMTFNRSTP